MTNMNRKKFFNDLITDYTGELNEKYNGLSYIGNHLVHINELSDNEAKGFYVGRTGKEIPFFALKDGDKIGFGTSYRLAADSLFFEKMKVIPEEERFNEFVRTHDKDKEYPVSDLWEWHRKLAFSCYEGGEKFMQKYNLTPETLMTV